MTTSAPIKKKKPIRLALTKGTDDPGVVLDIMPTMKNITHKGERFFRMSGAYQICEDGEWATLYLWDGYGRALRERLKAEGKWKE